MARQRSTASTDAAPAAVQVTNQTIEIAALAAHPRNYNRHPDQQIERIAASLRKFGQPRSIVVHRGTILAGHGVVEAARRLGWTEIRADVLPDDYPDHLALAYVAADNELSRQGDPDLAALAAIIDESRNADPELMQAIGYDEREFNELMRKAGAGGDDLYSRSIDSPVYKVTTTKPKVSQLFDDTRAQKLIEEIQAAEGITDEERQFLIHAARRHTVFNYRNIAEFYAHSSEGMQTLMENSALVIIDFNRAIELGYVRLAEGIAEQYGVDYAQ